MTDETIVTPAISTDPPTPAPSPYTFTMGGQPILSFNTDGTVWLVLPDGNRQIDMVAVVEFLKQFLKASD